MSKKNKTQTDERRLENYLFAADKSRMNSLVVDMMTRVISSLDLSLQALKTSDLSAAEKVIDDDDTVDFLEEEIDQECLYSIAMRQPLREDLRFVYAVMKIVTDIERIGDETVKLARRLKIYAEDYGITNQMPNIEGILAVGARLTEMGNDFLTAFQNEDAGLLETTKSKKTEVAEICDNNTNLLMDRITSQRSKETPAEIICAVDIFRHLRRINDHNMNLAEKVYFIATGLSPMTLRRSKAKN